MDLTEESDLVPNFVAFWGHSIGSVWISNNCIKISQKGTTGEKKCMIISYGEDMSVEQMDNIKIYFETELKGLEIAESEFPSLEKVFTLDLAHNQYCLEDIDTYHLAYHKDGPIAILSEEGIILDKISDPFKHLKVTSESTSMKSLSNGDYLITNDNTRDVNSCILITSYPITVYVGTSNSINPTIEQLKNKTILNLQKVNPF